MVAVTAVCLGLHLSMEVCDPAHAAALLWSGRRLPPYCAATAATPPPTFQH